MSLTPYRIGHDQQAKGRRAADGVEPVLILRMLFVGLEENEVARHGGDARAGWETGAVCRARAQPVHTHPGAVCRGWASRFCVAQEAPGLHGDTRPTRPWSRTKS